MSNMKFDYYYGLESEQFQFIRLPKMLVEDKHFQVLSDRAKILYGILLDRMSLSRKENWLDKENRVYILFSINSVAEALNCSAPTACKAMAELDSEHGIGLIERHKRGQGKPDIIYVKNFISYEENNPNLGNPKEWAEEDIAGAPDDVSAGNADKQRESLELKNLEFKEFESLNLKSLNSKTLNSKTFNSGIKEPLILDIKGFESINTNNNYTENNKTEYIACKQELVLIDTNKYLLEGDIFDIETEMEEENGIPYYVNRDMDMATKMIQYICGWNEEISTYSGQMERNTYVLALQSLVDMVTARGTREYNGQRVNYVHVIDALNAKWKNDASHMPVFMRICVDRFIDALKTKEIKNYARYMKALIWGNIASSELEWQSYIHRSYGERVKEMSRCD